MSHKIVQQVELFGREPHVLASQGDGASREVDREFVEIKRDWRFVCGLQLPA